MDPRTPPSITLAERAKRLGGKLEPFLNRFEICFDLVFANASLQWIDDYESVTNRLLEAVKPSEVFAFQTLALYDQPVARAIHDVSESPAVEITRAFRPIHASHSHTGRISRLARSAIEAASDLGDGLFSRTGQSPSPGRFLFQLFA